MAGYTRQQVYFDEDIILAEHTNDEYDQLVRAFDANTGHSHDGTPGEGSFIRTLSDGDNDTRVTVEETVDEDKIHFYAMGSKKATVDSLGLLIGDRFRISYNVVSDTLDIGVE